VKKIANQLDFGEFWQLILYFGRSTHIENRIKISTVTFTVLLYCI